MRIPSALGFTLALLIVGGFLWLPCISVLKITDTNAETVQLCARMNTGEEFVISFIHSVNKRPVHDTLRAQGDHIIIANSIFDAFGAGMPEVSTQEGELSVLPDGLLKWTVNRQTPEIIVRVGRVAQHTLKLKGREIPLAQLAEPGRALTFRVCKVSILSFMKGGCHW